MKKLLVIALVLSAAALIGVRERVVDDVDLFAVRSGSMGEAAPIGSLVVTRPLEAADVGDVITYDLANGEVITHRITEIQPDGRFVTKGDTNDWRDPWSVSPDVVRGVVERVYPDAGYALVYLTLPIGVASVFSAVLTLVLLWGALFPKMTPDPTAGRSAGTPGSRSEVTLPSEQGPMPGRLAQATGAVLLVAVVVAVFAPHAAAQESRRPDVQWCGGALPAFDLADMLPGDSRRVDLHLCNAGDAPGQLTLTTSATGALGSLVDVSIDDHWSGTLDDLAEPVTIGGATVGPGEQVTYRLRIGLATAVDNRWAGQGFDVDLVVALTDDTAVLGISGERGVEVPASVGTLPRTGTNIGVVVLAGLAAMATGVALHRAAGRRSRSPRRSGDGRDR